MRTHSFFTTAIAVSAVAMVAACSPKYDWRDYSSPDAPYRVMFPGKPATYTRSVNLDGLKVDMTMTATEVEGAMYAVGHAEAPDAGKARAALDAMKIALVRNIGATTATEKPSPSPAAATGGPAPGLASDVAASGVLNGVPMRLVAHFEARDKRLYQVVVIGPAKSIAPEPTEQFISSFKLL
jgi:hypothetical protein